jgi:ABC-type amino acid transport substrate-binding protein
MVSLKKIVDEMHADGTLAALSQKWFGADFTQATK